MQTRLSSKGQIVLPANMRRELGLNPGDTLEAGVEAGRIVLTPRHRPRPRPQIVRDPVTGLAALTFGAEAPVLTNDQVKAILADFP